MKDLNCKAWIEAATDGLDAKGGGKPDSAQYQVSGVEAVDTVLEKARKF
jgi:alanyl-tRNA synthetase